MRNLLSFVLLFLTFVIIGAGIAYGGKLGKGLNL